MRDSTGTAAPLRVIAFNLAGDTVTDAPATFIVLDPGAHMSGALLLGETPGSSVRVVGSVAGLQTQPATIKVTLSPDTLVAADSARHERAYSAADPSNATHVTSADLTVTVLHRGASDTGVEGVIVRYDIVEAPETIAIMSSNLRSSRDTTDAAGKAARTARLTRIAGAPATDSAIVDVNASYRGQRIGAVQFTIIFIRQ